MFISLEWLGQYVDLQGLRPEEIAEALTNAGLEVEDVRKFGCAFSGVKIGRISRIMPHPNADRLRLVTVDLGVETHEVVCGAPNVREGIKIAFAPAGAEVLNRQTGIAFTLEKTSIRGVVSAGMVCSIDELGLQDRFDKTEDGIWPLDAYVSESDIGKDCQEALGLKRDIVLEATPTANRGDLMSMIGVAREVAALFNRTLTLPEYPESPLSHELAGISVNLADASVCRYYGGLICRNIVVGPSPEWLVARLEAAGIRTINNMVDITNYVMLELGQPLHAFDLKKLGDAFVMGVRHARPGETLKTLDGVERSLTPDTVVITRNDAPVALAGLMGGEETEISDDATALFLESAYFPPASNRRSNKSAGLRSEAGARFERGVDPEMSRKALYRAASLLQELAGAEITALIESPPIVLPPLEIPLRLSRIPEILGISPDQETIRTILSRLGFQLGKAAVADIMPVSVPSYRREDVLREIDLIEEIIRIYGYDRVPYTLPRKTGTPVLSPRQEALSRIHRVLRAAGLQEVVTNSLIGPQLLEKTGFSLDEARQVAVTNSHSQDHTLMRQSLLPNLIEIAKYNQAQGNEAVWIYELGRTYFKMAKTTDKNAGVIEKLCASGLMIGLPDQGQWRLAAERRDSCDFYDLKGVMEQVLCAFQLQEEVFIQAIRPENMTLSHLHSGMAAEVLLVKNKKPIAVFGALHPLLQENLKFRQPVYVFEWDIETFLKEAFLKTPVSTPAGRHATDTLSPYPSVDRDMAFSAPETVSHRQIVETIRHLQEPLLKNITFFDEYRGAQIGEGNRSLAYRLTLQSDAQTLTETMIEETVSRVKSTLSSQLPITFR